LHSLAMSTWQIDTPPSEATPTQPKKPLLPPTPPPALPPTQERAWSPSHGLVQSSAPLGIPPSAPALQHGAAASAAPPRDVAPSAGPALLQAILPSEATYGGLLNASSLRTAFLAAAGSLIGLAAAAFIAGCVCSRTPYAGGSGVPAPSKRRRGFRRVARQEPGRCARHTQHTDPYELPLDLELEPSRLSDPRLWGYKSYCSRGRRSRHQHYSQVAVDLPLYSEQMGQMPGARRAFM